LAELHPGQREEVFHHPEEAFGFLFNVGHEAIFLLVVQVVAP
jgi:hypothetical protein